MACTRMFACLFVVFLVLSVAHSSSVLEGKWNFVANTSSGLPLWTSLQLTISFPESGVLHLIEDYDSGTIVNEMTVKLGEHNTVPIENRVFASNVFQGFSLNVNDTKDVQPSLNGKGDQLTFEYKYTLGGSQGGVPILSYHTIGLIDETERDVIGWNIDREFRENWVKYVFNRADGASSPDIKVEDPKQLIDSKIQIESMRARRDVDLLKVNANAYYYQLDDAWNFSDHLDEKAMLLSLQGLANRNSALLYFLYPKDWAFTYSQDVFKFYSEKRGYNFTELKSVKETVHTLAPSHAKGYVVFDKTVRVSLIVSFTVAGLSEALVVSEDQIPLMKELGIPVIQDFRGTFTNMTDLEIYSWAYTKYGPQCNKNLTIWLGGMCGDNMQPAIADWGVMQGAFHTDLSTKKGSTEYDLSSKIMADMNPFNMVMGWHSYCKDLERDFTTLTSSHTHRVEGLNTIPNLSFSYKVPPTPGFKFQNNHHIVPGKVYKPEKKVYLTAVQYFYTESTPNDYFIGALGGPGYMYPKAVPKDKLPHLLTMAKDMMDKLDIDVFEVMDYSEGSTIVGNTDLTKEVVDTYYEAMNNLTGFINGYAPAYTFTSRNGVPLLSFDYYLDPGRSDQDAVDDLRELAAVNEIRPYFLLMHIREWGDVTRTKRIIDQLGDEFELVALDLFLKMAGYDPTFKEHYAPY